MKSDVMPSIVQMEPEGKNIVRLLKELKGDRKIDYINTHGTGTESNDEIEGRAIQEVFTNQPFLNSTKGILVHTLGASGAIETAVTALSIKTSMLHAGDVIDPIEGLNLVVKPVKTPVTLALSTSYGFGGLNAGLVLGKYDGGMR